MKRFFRTSTVDSTPDASVSEAPLASETAPSLLTRLKRMVGIDTNQRKYAYGNDPRFGYISESRIADTWTKSTCGYCSVGCGMLIGTKDGKPVAARGNPDHPVNQGKPMANAKMFLKSGHPATLLASFLYFDFSFAIWVLNGAMAPFISEQYHLTPAQIGLMVSVPTLAGALMRFPLRVLSQYIGRKNTAIMEMTSICIALMYGFLFVHTFSNVLAMGVLLGIAGASFGVALSLGAGWFPKEYKGLAMGIAGAGNSGTAIAAFFAPRLARAHGWHTVYGIAAACMLLPLFVMISSPKNRRTLNTRPCANTLRRLPKWMVGLSTLSMSSPSAALSVWRPSCPRSLSASFISPRQRPGRTP